MASQIPRRFVYLITTGLYRGLTGCNRIVAADAERILAAVADFESAGCQLPTDRPTDIYGDGHSAEAIVHILAQRQ